MEVHAHSHTPRKKWRHYFWEFLMLFLAVFCGFLAEYQLEHVIENQRVKQYAGQLIQGLRQDTAELNLLIDFGEKKRAAFDSLFSHMTDPEGEAKWRNIYLFLSMAEQRRKFFAPMQTVFDQIKNAGALRYFKNEALVDRLTLYKSRSDRLAALQEMEFHYLSNTVTPFVDQAFDRKMMSLRFSLKEILKNDNYGSDPAISKNYNLNIPDKDTQRRLENILYKSAEWFYLPQRNIEDLKKSAEQLMTQIQKEYKLK